MGRDFLNLISKHFPNNSSLAKIFNKNNIKVCYSRTSNISQIQKKKKKNNKKITSINSARGVMVILDETDCISHSTNTLGKGMNPIILPPAMGK